MVNALQFADCNHCVRDGVRYQKNLPGGHPQGTLKKKGKARAHNGTTLTLPDSEIFTTTVYNFNTLSERLRESAFLLKGVKITLTDEREGQEKAEEYH